MIGVNYKDYTAMINRNDKIIQYNNEGPYNENKCEHKYKNQNKKENDNI